MLAQIRQQIHLITLFLGVILLMLPAYVNSFSLGVNAFERVAKDFGLTLISFYGVAMAVMLGSSVIPKDLEKKAVYPILGRPISRFQYLLCHFLALAALLLLSMLLLGVCITTSVGILGGVFDFRIFLAVMGYYFETTIILAASLCFSTFASPALAGVMSVFIYMVGGLSNAFIRFFLVEDRGNSVMASVAQALKLCLPSFQVFRLKDPVVHSLLIPPGYFGGMLVYWMAWLLLFLLLAEWRFSRKDL